MKEILYTCAKCDWEYHQPVPKDFHWNPDYSHKDPGSFNFLGLCPEHAEPEPLSYGPITVEMVAEALGAATGYDGYDGHDFGCAVERQQARFVLRLLRYGEDHELFGTKEGSLFRKRDWANDLLELARETS
jgi:hypothetical protein